MVRTLRRHAPVVASVAMILVLVVVSYPSDVWELLGSADRTIAVATWILALFALLQWRETREAAHAQLRAYVFVRQDENTPLKWSNDKPFHISATLVLENTGQTPAHEVRHWSKLGVRNHPTPERAFGREEQPMARGSIGPGRSVLIPLEDLIVTPDEWHALFAGSKRLYTWGEVAYRDAFGRTQTTAFRMVFSGVAGQRHGAAEICDEGNEAT